MKLHLGCGNKIWPGYENLDLPTDIRHLSYPPGSIEEIVAIHVFEHLFRHDAVACLGRWFALLQPQGRLVLELPCLDKILTLFARTREPYLTMWGLYGEPSQVMKNPAMQHLWCWGEDELRGEMERVGFVVTVEEPRFHKPIRDMRLVGTKP